MNTRQENVNNGNFPIDPESVMDTYDSRLEYLEKKLKEQTVLNDTMQKEIETLDAAMGIIEGKLIAVKASFPKPEQLGIKLTEDHGLKFAVKEKPESHDCKDGFRVVGASHKAGYNHVLVCKECGEIFDHDSMYGNISGRPGECPGCKQRIKL